MRVVGGFGASSFLTYTEFMAVYLRVSNEPNEGAGLKELFNLK